MNLYKVLGVYSHKTHLRDLAWEPLLNPGRHGFDEMQNDLNSQGFPLLMPVQAFKRKTVIFVSPPAGFHTLNPESTLEDDEKLFVERLATLPRHALIGMDPHRSPVASLQGSPKLYYRRELLLALDTRFPCWTYSSLAEQILVWESMPELFRDKKSRKFVPFAERSTQKNGGSVRGPDWSPAEDAILRRYFGRQPDGKRYPLSEARWKLLLDGELRRQRTKASVLARLSILNQRLRQSLLVDGILSHEAVVRYQEQRLGERNRLPNLRQRLHGGYFPKNHPMRKILLGAEEETP